MSDMENWYRGCEFIQEEMQFYSMKDFWLKANNIKYYYESSNRYVKHLYKWYVFANTNIKYENKCKIWNYLNGELDNFD
nr:MAG TPA: hypothetical protein [Caudoviricetes sp.]